MIQWYGIMGLSHMPRDVEILKFSCRLSKDRNTAIVE
jgi:hypothetical protein